MKAIIRKSLTADQFVDTEHPRGRGGKFVASGNTGERESRRVFDALLKDIRGKVEEHLRGYYNKLFDKVKAGMVGKGYQEAWAWERQQYRENRMDAQHMSQMVDMNARPTIQVSPYAQQYIDKHVSDNLQAMFDSFTEKQVGKIADIFKGRRVTASTGHINNSLEALFHFDLSDGAKFDMRTQIIWKTSNKGTRFWQFPTTFHNVYRGDGTRIATPSEDKLKAEL